jgi:hypothetical protein
MKNSELKVGQLLGVTWIRGANEGQKSGYRIQDIWPVYNTLRKIALFHITATNVKTNETYVFGFTGEEVPSNWILIEDAAPPQSNSK